MAVVTARPAINAHTQACLGHSGLRDHQFRETAASKWARLWWNKGRGSSLISILKLSRPSSVNLLLVSKHMESLFWRLRPSRPSNDDQDHPSRWFALRGCLLNKDGLFGLVGQANLALPYPWLLNHTHIPTGLHMSIQSEGPVQSFSFYRLTAMPQGGLEVSHCKKACRRRPSPSLLTHPTGRSLVG